MKSVDFGFLNEATEITWSNGANCIRPLSNHGEIVSDLCAESGIHGGWIYPPVGLLNHEAGAPQLPQMFWLPATHQMTFADAETKDDEADFMILLFGFLKGRRLQRDGWMHFYKTPLDDKLNDFSATNSAIAATLDVATAFWQRHDEHVHKLAYGALHWHLFAQLYEREFESFSAQYTALDACAELARCTKFEGVPSGRLPHAERAATLCDRMGIPKPDWVKPSGDGPGCNLARRRNALVHDAMYAEAPIGFAYPADGDTMLLGLTALVARIFLRVIGVRNDYTASSCTTRRRMGFEMPK